MAEIPKISVVINTYNAQQYLPQVLESAGQFDEILICDMESTDDTLQIAQAYGCRVITFRRRGHNIVEPAREYAIHRATYPWVLVVDADELVTPELRHYLYDIIASADDLAGLMIPRRNHFMGRFMHGSYPDYILRFFRRDNCFWPPVIHSQPQVQGKISKVPLQKRDLAFIHLPDETVHDRLQKTDRYTDNEIPRRKGTGYGWAAFFYRPLHRFLKSYVLKRGFLDGYPGFIYALLDAIYQIIMLSKLKEAESQSSQKEKK